MPIALKKRLYSLQIWENHFAKYVKEFPQKLYYYICIYWNKCRTKRDGATFERLDDVIRASNIDAFSSLLPSEKIKNIYQLQEAWDSYMVDLAKLGQRNGIADVERIIAIENKRIEEIDVPNVGSGKQFLLGKAKYSTSKKRKRSEEVKENDQRPRRRKRVKTANKPAVGRKDDNVSRENFTIDLGFLSTYQTRLGMNQEVPAENPHPGYQRGQSGLTANSNSFFHQDHFVPGGVSPTNVGNNNEDDDYFGFDFLQNDEDISYSPRGEDFLDDEEDDFLGEELSLS